MALGTGKAFDIKPETIPKKLEQCFDSVAVKPTRRTFGFIKKSGHSIISQTDTALREQIKEAQKGTHYLKVVFATPLHDITAFTFKAKYYPKSNDDNTLIRDVLKDNFVFDHLSSSQCMKFIGSFEPVIFTKGAEIIKQGDVGDYFYIIGAGRVSYHVDGQEAGVAGVGENFGDLALLYNAPRAATCIAKTECELFRLDQETFRRLLAQQSDNKDVIKILKQVPYFKELDNIYLNKIACNMKVSRFRDGDVIAHKGEARSDFYIIQNGMVEVTDIEFGGSKCEDAIFNVGQFFGDSVIVDNAPAPGTATAKGSVIALHLNRRTFTRVLGNDMGKLVRRTFDKRQLKLIPFGKWDGPAENEYDILAASVVEKKFPRDHTFFREGQGCIPALYLIRKGKVTIQSAGGGVKVLESKGYFGNDTIASDAQKNSGIAKYTVQAEEEVEVGVLGLDTILSTVASRDQSADSVQLKDLEMIRILGAGTFGKVWLVRCKSRNEAFALKVQVKRQLIKSNHVLSVIREKNIMVMLDHPFVAKLLNSYKDDGNLYMLMNMYQGGELRTIVHSESGNGLPEYAAKFYAANILEGLAYMHHRNVLYRDLKPGNVLLDSDGYAVIVDLGFAKLLKGKTYTFCGTPLYLAPEIIRHEGLDISADYWSWGVVLYEMIVGMTPFYHGNADERVLFKNILKCNYELPSSMSSSSQDLIKRMLVVNPVDRLGSFAGADKDIKAHPFFEDIDWNKLKQKKTKVPFKPKIENSLDGSNYDDFSKLEAEKIVKGKKLTKHEQNMFLRF